MPLWIQITPGSNKPIYIQIVEQICDAIVMGKLAVGQKLPAVRKLAAELVINPNTVARAYKTLEQARLVTTKTGSGTFITNPKLQEFDAVDYNILLERINAVVSRGLSLGLEPEQLRLMFLKSLNKFTQDNDEDIK